ncbi:MAG TPA: ATP-binding cassette domain-containing protein [Thermoleophilaceae bacterium]
MPEPILAARGLTYRYPDAAEPALRDVTLELDAGSFTVVAGESGSGKSTLLRAACGLVPHFHGGDASGELTVAGMAVRDHGPSELAAVCGTVLQEPETQVVMGGVRAEIALPLEHRGESPTAVARAVEETALALGVAHLLDRRVDTLSGGELQRVALAAALAGRPSLLVLDEPSSQLDPVAGDELVWLLRRLNEEWGIAVLLAEHRIERCLAAADRVVAMERGAVACDAAPDEFLRWAAAERPALATPAARLFARAGLAPLPVSVREARDRLRSARLLPAGAERESAEREPADGPPARRPSTAPGTSPAPSLPPGDAPATATSAPSRRLLAGLLRRRRPEPAIAFRGVWHEVADGPAILRGIELSVAPGERVALMGRNGAGKSTLLRHARGLLEPTRGRVERAGEVALLLQTPGDYLVHERVEQELGAAGIEAAGLAGRERDNPRDLSGGERQRLALEIVLGGGQPPAAVCLDEPTRGMDRARKDRLARRLRELAAAGSAVVVATHDTELAAEVADRVVLLGQGVAIADGPVADVLAGGRHFTTDVARILDGAGGALTPDQGARLLQRELVA